MSKHNRAAWEKRQRNLVYARKFRQLRCDDCGHRTSVPGKCGACAGRIKSGDFARSIKRSER